MLTLIRTVHTIVWALFVGCIVGIFVYADAGKFDTALLLIGIIVGEMLILVLNRWRCPLTNLAWRYTDDRADNFDIYLPLWLARHNKTIFGGLFLCGIVYTIFRWLS